MSQWSRFGVKEGGVAVGAGAYSGQRRRTDTNWCTRAERDISRGGHDEDNAALIEFATVQTN